MDDTDKDQSATETAIGSAGSTLGGAAVGAVAGTALGTPVVGTVIGALSGAAIGAARKRTTRKAKAASPKKKEFNDKKAIDKSGVDELPQSYQKDRGQNADAESSRSLGCTPDGN